MKEVNPMNKAIHLMSLGLLCAFLFGVSVNHNTTQVASAVENESDQSQLEHADYYLINSREVLNDDFHIYHLRLEARNSLSLNDGEYLSVYWKFDDDTFVGNQNDLTMSFTVSSDPTSVHVLSIKMYLLENNIEKEALSLDKYYIKDGNVLSNFHNNREVGLRMIYLPIIAVLMLIGYLIYFHRQQHSGGLDFASERLAHIYGMSSTIEDTLTNNKISDKAKLKVMKKTYKNIKSNLITVLHLINAISLENSISIDNKAVLNEIKNTISFMEKADLKVMTLDDFDYFYQELFNKHIAPSLDLCRRVIAAHKKYLKETYGDI